MDVSLEKIFIEARESQSSKEFNDCEGISYFDNGHKITKYKDGSIAIFNTQNTGNYYRELEPKDYAKILLNGWSHGTLILSLYYKESEIRRLNEVYSDDPKRLERRLDEVKTQINKIKSKLFNYGNNKKVSV